jgi:hypothetical protein
MKTTYPVLIVLALGVAGTMWGMSGITAMYDGPQDDLQSQEELNESASSSSVTGYEADAGPNQGGNIVGLIFSGISRLVSLAGLVLLLPAEMHNIGFPWWFSLPIGLLAQTLVGIGIIEFATQREWT